jgi:putative membrane protein
MRIVIRLLINALAIWLAAQLLAGLQLTGGWVGIAIVAMVFGLVNAFIRPVVKLLSLPITCLTLGLFTFVINALMLMLTAWLAGNYLSLGASTGEQIVNALLGSIIISIVSSVLSWFLPDKKD